MSETFVALVNGTVVPAGLIAIMFSMGLSLGLRDFAEVIPQLEQKLTKRGIPGVILDLEPHLKGGGQFGGFSGPDGMGVALRGLCRVLDHVGIDYHLRDFDDIRAARGF